MFEELMNFKLQRNKKQAIGFYIVYFLIGGLLGAVFSGLMQFGSDANYQTQYHNGIKIGAYVALLYCTTLSLIILVVKKLYKSLLGITLVLLTILGAMILGGLTGCIFPAILSTFEAKN